MQGAGRFSTNDAYRQKLVAFNQVTLDGYFAGHNGDISWAFKDGADKEWNDFGEGNTRSAGILISGRLTYELMAAVAF